MKLLPHTFFMTVLVWTGTASTLYGRLREEENYLDAVDKSDSFYPVADEDENILGPSRIDKNNNNKPLLTTLNSSSNNVLSGKYGDRGKDTSHKKEEEDHEERVLIKSIKLLFQNYGHKPSDMRHIFLPNSSFFSVDIPTTTTKRPKSSTVDEYSLSKFREKINRIVDRNQGVKEELRDLLRVIKEIEIDDFSEVLKLIENFNQGYQRNRTLLIAMIQAAAQQWAEPDSLNLPPPFGDRNDSLPPINISNDLRGELLDLSDLLTNDLKQRLVQILSVDHNETQEEILDEMAIAEEDENGNMDITVHGHRTGSVLKPKRETFNSPESGDKVTVDQYEEGDDDDFTITEELVLENDADDNYDDQKKEKDDSKISNAYLENIIRKEHRAKSVEDLTRSLRTKRI